MRPSEESETLPEIRGQMETDSETLPEIQGQMERERDAAGNPGTDRQIARSCWKARDRARGCRKAGDRWKQRARRCRRARDRARDVAGKPEPESETLPESRGQMETKPKNRLQCRFGDTSEDRQANRTEEENGI